MIEVGDFRNPSEMVKSVSQHRIKNPLLVNGCMAGFQFGNFKRGGGEYRTGRDALTKSEYEKVLAVAGSFENILLIRLAVASGMRREDIVNVKIKDIDFSQNSMSFFEHKKDKIHMIFLAPDLMQFIGNYLQTLPKGQTKLFDFCSKTAYNRFHELLERAGIRKRPFHSLRSTCIKFCQANGWTPAMTAAHVDDTIATIQEHYEVPSLAEMKEVAETKGFA